MEELWLSAKERVRLDAMHRVERNAVTVIAAAELTDVSVRQARRLWKRYKSRGDAGLIHRIAGESAIGDWRRNCVNGL